MREGGVNHALAQPERGNRKPDHKRCLCRTSKPVVSGRVETMELNGSEDRVGLFVRQCRKLRGGRLGAPLVDGCVPLRREREGKGGR